MKKFLFSLVAISSIVTLAFSFEKGDTVYICMSNSSTCKAIMIMEGSDESKVELRESCTVALFSQP
ncbi:hypothetical protein KKC13_06975 [bacterium]|nr:hypothetical protein [bacterium]MBU1956968.1 hypothetical protein [bacterium]